MTMAEDQQRGARGGGGGASGGGGGGGQAKGRRSASICAPGLSSMEEAMMASSSSSAALQPPAPPTIETSAATPRATRRRPATRSQSARATSGGGGKPRVRRRDGSGGGGSRAGSRAGSEPRLDAPSISASSSPRLQRRATARPHIPVVVTDGDCDDAPLTASAAARRRRSLRATPTGGGGGGGSSPPTQWKRGNSVKATRSKGGFLDVPGDDSRSPLSDEDDESYRLRSFSLTSKGVVNRGDSFRRRRSRSNSLLPPGQQDGAVSDSGDADGKVEGLDCKGADGSAAAAAAVTLDPYRVAMVGTQGVGKTALISQFMTSECINAYDRQSRDEPAEQSVSIMLNGEESELWFINVNNSKTEIDPTDPPDAFVVMYSVIDKASFQRAEDELERLQDWDLLRSRPAILVGNKVDLVRSRAVSTQDGKCLACTYRAKFIEISVGINHNVDELLVGILSQIRLKNEQFKNKGAGDGGGSHWYKSRGVVRASMKARQVFTWLFGKEDSKFKNCENLHVL